jgi:hypothetical protein
MTTTTETRQSENETTRFAASTRADALARRLEQGIDALIAFARPLTDGQWRTPVPKDGRAVGVVVHHVANMLPLEIQLAQTLARGEPITGVTWEAVHEINAAHAKEHAAVTKADAIELLRKNCAAAAAAVRTFTDAELAAAATISLYADAPLTCQFMLEDHAVRHAYHHLAKIQGALKA